MTKEEDTTDPFDKVAAREAQLEDLPGSYQLSGKVSFFVTMLLLLPLHWIISHDWQWLVIIHVVAIAIAGGSVFGSWVGSRARNSS